MEGHVVKDRSHAPSQDSQFQPCGMYAQSGQILLIFQEKPEFSRRKIT